MVAALETPESWCAARVHAHVQARRVPCGRERLPDRRRDRWLFRWPALHAALCGHAATLDRRSRYRVVAGGHRLVVAVLGYRSS